MNLPVAENLIFISVKALSLRTAGSRRSDAHMTHGLTTLVFSYSLKHTHKCLSMLLAEEERPGPNCQGLQRSFSLSSSADSSENSPPHRSVFHVRCYNQSRMNVNQYLPWSQILSGHLLEVSNQTRSSQFFNAMFLFCKRLCNSSSK